MARKRGTTPRAKRQIARAADLLPEGYEEFLGELKERIRTARLRASPGPARIDRQSTRSSAIDGVMLYLGTSRRSRVGAPQGEPRARALVPGCVAWPPNG